MSRLEEVRTSGAPEAIGPYSQAVIAGPWVYSSGQIGLDPATGALAPGGLEEEAHQVVSNLEAVLAAAGCGMDRLVKVTVYLTDRGDFPVLNRIYEEPMGGDSARNSDGGRGALPKGARVEIDYVALLAFQG